MKPAPTPSPCEQAAARLRSTLSGSVRVQGLQGGARAWFLWRWLAEETRPVLLLTPTAREAETLVDDLRWLFAENEEASPLARRLHHFPAWDVPPFEDLSPSGDVIAARIEGLYHLQQTARPIVVAPAEALLLRVPPRETFAARLRYLVQGDELDLVTTAEQLVDWGYRRVGLVEERGDFAVRGGILDVFPAAHAQPLRIELFGDQIETIHEFDPLTQRSLGEQAEFLLLPVREFDGQGRSNRDALRRIEERAFDLELDREDRRQILEGLAHGALFPGVEFFLPYFYPQLDTLAAYLPKDMVVCLDGAGAVDATVETGWQDAERRGREKAEGHRFAPVPESLYLSPGEWRGLLAGRTVVELEPLRMMATSPDERHLSLTSFLNRDLRLTRIPGRREVSFAPVAEKVQAWARDRLRTVVVCGSSGQVERLARLFENHGLGTERPPGLELALSAPPGVPQLIVGHLTDGFRLPEDGIALITESDIFGEARQRRRGRRANLGQLLKNLSELKPDDFVVHVDHGVGCYRGLKHLSVGDTEGDFLHLEYAGGDRLYLPVDRINLVTKYVGAEGSAPALDRLGGTSWERTKQQTREAILAMAKELLDVYAHREIVQRSPFRQPDGTFREFEAAFPFEETDDQQRAIDETLADMQRDKPMDRLVCGDVGFGKTEVALRAAFLAALDGRQVAMLVPTTILAEQHAETFRRRLQDQPVRVESLSRFRAATENKEVVKGLASGTVDIVIGTHRLLQKDIVFRNLGLLIIDEEHRFGVKHKEQIKQMRKLVDCLTLTATPIPRTLQMSMLGIRDLSVIETPPIDRLAVRTYVTRYDEGVIRDAILREKTRGGQAFFVHNRVETIEMRARRLREIVPECTFSVAHGQMKETELDSVMRNFLEKKTDVLVASAIIESGLDIPNANTILIDRADLFGLAQLYQLRGRVGRSHERAYAYLMIPGEEIITRDAQMRLRALQELDDLGGGFRLATHDLEIRGAGNLLGKQQSGQVVAVGFELYEQMLQEAVQELRGQAVTHEVEPEMQLGIPAYLPETYIPDENQRLVFYRRLASIHASVELDEIAGEMRDRFGPMPPMVDNFLRVMDLRRVLKACSIVRAVLQGGQVTLQFHPEAPVDIDRLVDLVKRSRGRYRLSPDFQFSFARESTDTDGLVEEIQALLQKVSGR